MKLDPYCPVFKLDQILTDIEPNENKKYKMLSQVEFRLTTMNNLA